jgi:filamentous hemagglutinin
LSRLENATENAHFLSRHGPLTTLDQQLERAVTGRTPDGMNLRAVDSARWLRHEDMLDGVNLAHAKHVRTGDPVVTVDFDRIIGEGYMKSGDVYATTNQAVFVFRDGKPYTFYPLLKAE